MKKRQIMIGIVITVVVLSGLIAVWWLSPEPAPAGIQVMNQISNR